jgi:AraC-like DNA-binding protein
MFAYKIQFIDRFNFPQKTSYTIPQCQIIFYVKGLVSLSQPGYDLITPSPFLSIRPAGTPIEFEFNEDRENWVIQIKSSEVRLGKQEQKVECLTDNAWVSLPSVAFLNPEKVSFWQNEFMNLKDAYKDPHPKNILRIKTGISSIIQYLLDSEQPTSLQSAASKLKNLIANDSQCKKNLDQLSNECGYSSDHLRKLFISEYGISPQKYRNRNRLAMAQDLLQNSDLPISEIALRTGFEHSSHFSTMIKEHLGVSPLKISQMFRSRIS